MCQKILSKDVDLLLIREEGKKHNILIKDFNSFMYNHRVHRGPKHFCRHCLQGFGLAEILKIHVNVCFEISK